MKHTNSIRAAHPRASTLFAACLALWVAATCNLAAQQDDADPALPPYAPTAQVSGTAHGITGMDSVELMMRAWNEAFRKYHPGAEITIEQKSVGPEERIALGPNMAEIFHR